MEQETITSNINFSVEDLTPEAIIQRLLDKKNITVREAMILLKSITQKETSPYQPTYPSYPTYPVYVNADKTSQKFDVTCTQ